NSQFADKAFNDIQAALKTGDKLKPGELENFAELAEGSGRQDLLDKASPILAAKDIQDKIPEGTSLAVVEAQVKALKASGVSGPERAVLNQLHNNVRQSAEALVKEPLVEGSRKSLFGPINQFNLANPQAVVGELQDRQRKAELLQQHNPSQGPIPVIVGQEAAELGVNLTSGDPARAAQFLSALSTLPDQTYV